MQLPSSGAVGKQERAEESARVVSLLGGHSGADAVGSCLAGASEPDGQ